MSLLGTSCRDAGMRPEAGRSRGERERERQTDRHRKWEPGYLSKELQKLILTAPSWEALGSRPSPDGPRLAWILQRCPTVLASSPAGQQGGCGSSVMGGKARPHGLHWLWDAAPAPSSLQGPQEQTDVSAQGKRKSMSMNSGYKQKGL